MMPTVGLERNSKMVVNCSVQWSWKRKEKPNFGCHSNTSISMSDILISVSSWYSNKWLSYIRLNVKVTRVSYVFSFDLRSRDILFRKIFFYYGQPGTMITIFAWFHKILALEIARKITFSETWLLEGNIQRHAVASLMMSSWLKWFHFTQFASSFQTWRQIEAIMRKTWILKITENGFDFRRYLTIFRAEAKKEIWVCLKDSHEL